MKWAQRPRPAPVEAGRSLPGSVRGPRCAARSQQDPATRRRPP